MSAGIWEHPAAARKLRGGDGNVFLILRSGVPWAAHKGTGRTERGLPPLRRPRKRTGRRGLFKGELQQGTGGLYRSEGAPVTAVNPSQCVFSRRSRRGEGWMLAAGMSRCPRHWLRGPDRLSRGPSKKFPWLSRGAV